jgi:hypothetical protein
MLHGASIAALLALGAACRIGSMPLTKVTTVPTPAVPSVERMITASPLCKSAKEAAGTRLSIC